MVRRLAVFGMCALVSCGPVPSAAPAPHAAGFKPFAFAILEDWDKGDDLGEVARDFALFHELGITTWRGSLGWDDYEPAPGALDTTWLSRFLHLAAREGIVLRPYVGYTPEWAARGDGDGAAWNDPPRSLHEWRRFLAGLGRLLARHGNVRSLEIYNEENARLWWDGTSEEYAAVLGAAIEELHRVAPRLEVLPGGLVWPDAEWLETSCAGGTGGRIHAIAVHAYPETWTPDSVPLERWLDGRFAERFLPAAEAACGRKPVWVNEAGYATIPGRTEEQQAAWWVRAVATFASLPRVEQVGVYEIKDQRPGTAVIGDAPNYYLGLTRVDRGRKLAFATVRMLVRLYGGDGVLPLDSALTLRVQDGVRDSVFAHAVLRPDGRQILAIWTRSLPAVVDVALPRPVRRVLEYQLDGRSTETSPAFDRVRLEPGRPRVFEGRP